MYIYMYIWRQTKSFMVCDCLKSLPLWGFSHTFSAAIVSSCLLWSLFLWTHLQDMERSSFRLLDVSFGCCCMMKSRLMTQNAPVHVCIDPVASVCSEIINKCQCVRHTVLHMPMDVSWVMSSFYFSPHFHLFIILTEVDFCWTFL